MNNAMTQAPTRSPAEWLACDLEAEQGWIHRLGDNDRADLLRGLCAGAVPGKPLFK
jgi:hypothetical protein